MSYVTSHINSLLVAFFFFLNQRKSLLVHKKLNLISHYTRLGVKNHESYYLAKKKFRNFNAALTIYNDETPLISLLISFLGPGVTATSLVINPKQKHLLLKIAF